MKMKKSQAALLTTAIIFAAVAFAFTVAASVLAIGIIDISRTPAEDAGEAFGQGIGIFLLAALDVIGAIGGGVFSALALTSSLVPLRSKESHRAHVAGLVLLIASAAMFLVDVAAFCMLFFL